MAVLVYQKAVYSTLMFLFTRRQHIRQRQRINKKLTRSFISGTGLSLVTGELWVRLERQSVQHQLKNEISLESVITVFMSITVTIFYILIADGGTFSTFPTHLHLQIHMPTSSLSSYLAASAKNAVTLFRQIVTLRGITLPISYNV